MKRFVGQRSNYAKSAAAFAREFWKVFYLEVRDPYLFEDANSILRNESFLAGWKCKWREDKKRQQKWKGKLWRKAIVCLTYQHLKWWIPWGVARNQCTSLFIAALFMSVRLRDRYGEVHRVHEMLYCLWRIWFLFALSIVNVLSFVHVALAQNCWLNSPICTRQLFPLVAYSYFEIAGMLQPPPLKLFRFAFLAKF